MTGFLTNRLTAAATALALGLGAITASATPALARSNDDDVLKWILGLGAAAVILHEIDKNKPNTPVTRQQYPNNYRYYDYDTRRYQEQERNRYQTRTLPQNCLIQVRSQNGRRDVVSGNCLKREMSRVDLPRACAFDLITDNKRRETVYGRNCLEDRGYRISRR